MNIASKQQRTVKNDRIRESMSLYRNDFPALNQIINGQKLVYLDSAASSQMPNQVIDEIARYQSNDHANVHRGIHTLSHRATNLFEETRKEISNFINSTHTNEIIFTSGTTESINLVAQSFCRPILNKNKKILISQLEHHSNIVPWQIVCKQTGAKLLAAPINQDGQIEVSEMIKMIDSSVALIAISHASNALGTICPIDEIIQAAHGHDVPVLIDGAQAIPHMRVDVQELNADFYVFSGHKMLGPTGIGILYGKENILEAMPPYQGGGDMILEVKLSGTTYNELPYKFEAGTPNISGVAGLRAAINYLNNVGLNNIQSHEKTLLEYLTSNLEKLEELDLIGTASNKVGVQSFIIKDIHSHDIGTILDHQGIAIRTGHHCAMPVMDYYQISGTARASLALYNNTEDIDRLIQGLKKVIEIFA
ncbi:MAG: SufS family cysteine desulfurase [Pseudomonadota bacterium]|nr:SufS family cysteine desulfurase [Pseudomonadota bacterium]